MPFTLFVIPEPLMYFRVCHGTPTNKNIGYKSRIAYKKIKYFVTTLQKILNTLTNKQLLQVLSLRTTTFTTVNLMLLRSKPYDHVLTCRHNNKLQRYSADFPSLSSTNSDFELTLTLIIITNFLSVPKPRIYSNLSEY